MIWQGAAALFNLFLKAIGAMLTGLVSILPASPFQTISNMAVNSYMPYINWLVPINEIVSILQAWIIAVTLFYIYSIALRWAKAIN